MAQPPVDRPPSQARERMEEARDAAAERVEQARLTFRRLVGLDRSGPPPPQTLAGQPWHVWTIPNAIGFVRLALIPVFLVLALQLGHGHRRAARRSSSRSSPGATTPTASRRA